MKKKVESLLRLNRKNGRIQLKVAAVAFKNELKACLLAEVVGLHKHETFLKKIPAEKSHFPDDLATALRCFLFNFPDS